MFKLVKWTVVGVLGAGATGYFMFGDHLGSYFSTATSALRDGVRGRIPLEFELQRAEKLVQAIDPEIDECKRDLARAEVELDHMVRDVGRLKEKVVQQEAKLRGGNALVGGAETVSYHVGGRTWSRRRVELDLERTFDAFRNNKGLLSGKEKLIEKQSNAVLAAKARLDAVRSERIRLEQNIAMLKTQKRQLEALAATSSRFELDDSSLAKAKEVLAEVQKRLDVAQKLIEDDIFFSEGIDAPRANRDILKEIAEHFDGRVAAPATEDAEGKVAPAALSRR